MNKLANNNNREEQNLKILQQISKDSNISQRRMAKDLGLSLGKMNYCLGELKKKGLLNSSYYYVLNTLNR